MTDERFQLQRLGMLMEPEPGNPQEIEGVLNPAAARGPDGHLYLFPRLVAQGQLFAHRHCPRQNSTRPAIRAASSGWASRWSRKPITSGRPDGGGGCEDPRITFVEPLQRYVMTYAALSSVGPRIALAISEDLFHWKRLGLATFAPYEGIDFVHVDNKDASLFPVAIPNHCRKNADGPPASAALPRHASRGNRLPCKASRQSISIMKASGFPTARCLRRGTNRSTSASSIRITGWPRRSRPGSG